jgi:glucose uptake protein GlcU
MASIVATQLLGLAVAYPIMQSGLFVAGLWGILLFGELSRLTPQLVYWVGGVALTAGAVLLVVSK